MTCNPQDRICSAPLLTPPERQFLLEHRGASAGCERCLHELFERQAETHAQSAAVICGDQAVSYAALNGEANWIARELLSLELGDRPVVAIGLTRSPAMIAAMLGVLKAGGSWVAVDPLWPVDRIGAVLEHCRPGALIAEPQTIPGAQSARCPVLLLERERDAVSHPNPSLPVTPDSLACILYLARHGVAARSVMIDHRSLPALVDWAGSVYSAQDLAAVLAASVVNSMSALFEMLVPLCSGGSVVLARDILALPELPARDAVTLINTVPTAMRALLDAAGCAFPASLRVVNLTGEPVPGALVDRVYRHSGAQRVYELYSTSGAATIAACKLRLRQGPASMGRPTIHGRCYVLDDHGLPVPRGVVGELYLAGEGLARGYLHQPDLTGQRFSTPSAGCIPEQRLFRTHDRVRYTNSGELQYWGRAGEECTVQGFPVDPAEVRQALLTADGVEDAWVLSRPAETGGSELVAHIAASGDHCRRKRCGCI